MARKVRAQPLLSVHDVPKASRWYQRVLGAQSGHGGEAKRLHTNPNAGHRELWLRDLDGYLVVLAGK